MHRSSAIQLILLAFVQHFRCYCVRSWIRVTTTKKEDKYIIKGTWHEDGDAKESISLFKLSI